MLIIRIEDEIIDEAIQKLAFKYGYYWLDMTQQYNSYPLERHKQYALYLNNNGKLGYSSLGCVKKNWGFTNIWNPKTDWANIENKMKEEKIFPLEVWIIKDSDKVIYDYADIEKYYKNGGQSSDVQKYGRADLL